MVKIKAYLVWIYFLFFLPIKIFNFWYNNNATIEILPNMLVRKDYWMAMIAISLEIFDIMILE